MLLLLSAKFFKINFFKYNFGKTIIRVSNGLYPDQGHHSVGPGLSPNSYCFQRSSTDDIIFG